VVHRIVWIALGGAVGTVARYTLAGLVQRLAGDGFPWGTFAVNFCGCFLFGLCWAVAEHRVTISPEIRLTVLVGFMGAFTTFSTYAFETSGMLRESQWWTAAGNVAGQNLLGVAALFVGLAVGRLV